MIKSTYNRISNQGNLLTNWDSRIKLLCIIFAILISALVQQLIPIIFLLIAGLIICVLSQLSFKQLLKRLLFLTLFFIPCFAIIPIRIENVSESWRIIYDLDGLFLAMFLYLRALTIVSFSFFLLETTPFHLILHSAEKLHFPKVLLQITMLTHRFIFSSRREIKNIRTAMAVRGFQNQFNLHSYKTLANVIGIIMVKSIEKTERLNQSMKSRGYQGEIKSLYQFKSQPIDFLLCALFLLLITIALFLDLIYKV